MIKVITDVDQIPDADLRRMGENFMAEAGHTSPFDLDYFKRFWSTALRMGVAACWAAMEDDRVHGLIGMLLSQCPYSGDVVAIETFWYIDPDKRRGLTGVKMFKQVEAWVKEVGAKRVTFSSVVNTTESKIQTFYELAGFKKYETHYVKEV